MRTTYKILSIAVTSLLFSQQLQAAPKTKYIPDGYKIETIELPAKVPMQIAGLDTDKNDNVYVATRLGDVWKYSDGNWSKFASGLHEATGLLCDDDGSIVVAHKPELTRLVDTDNDGVADEQIVLANDWEFHDNYHEFNFGPVKDSKGNYFGTLNLSHSGGKNVLKLGAMGSAGGYRGFAYQVTPKGEFVPYAWGLRSPAGIGISPKDEVFFTDNQGDWVATSKMHIIEKGKFYGHPVSLRDVPGYTIDWIKNATIADFDKIREKPVVWIPHIEVANSPGNPEWNTTEGKFGPFKDQIFVGDVTQSNIFRVLLDKVNGKYQGAVINFIDGFQSGNIRLNFDKNGQLWVGQTTRGWGAKGGVPFGLQKVVWDGTNPFELLDIKLTKTGFKLNFTEKLDPKSIKKGSFNVQQWHYLYHDTYGSPKIDEENVNVNNVSLSANGKQIEINLPLTADKVVEIDFSGIRSASGRKVSTAKLYYTLNELLN